MTVQIPRTGIQATMNTQPGDAMQVFAICITPLMLAAAIWLVLRTARVEEEELEGPTLDTRPMASTADMLRPGSR